MKTRNTFSGNYNKPFPVALRNLMQSTAKTQKEVSEAIGKTTQSVSQYMNGQSEPGYETLVKIADCFNCSVDYLLGRTEAMSTDSTIRAVCDYTGLSERSISVLHNETLSADEIKIAKTFIDTFFNDEKDYNRFAEMGKMAAALLIVERNSLIGTPIDKLSDDDWEELSKVNPREDRITTINDLLSSRKNNSGLIEVTMNEASLLYTRMCTAYLNFVFDCAIQSFADNEE